MNQLLAICIPTYNRANHLRECIEKLIPQISKYNNPIYISDNCSEDRTAVVVAELQRIYPFIFYSKSERNMGADYNFTHVLKMSVTKYSWLLGDDDRIGEDVIESIMMLLQDQTDLDALVVNGGALKNAKIYGRVTDVVSKIYQDPNLLLAELGWHMTWMSCLIFSKRIINGVVHEKYYNTNFLQFAIMFEYLANKKVAVYWLADSCIYAASKEEAAWSEQTFNIFAKKWYEIVSNLPNSYTIDAKGKCIIDHGVKSNLFSLRSLISLREKNVLNVSILREYDQYLPYVIKWPVPVLFLIVKLPEKLIYFARVIYKLLKSKRVGSYL